MREIVNERKRKIRSWFNDQRIFIFQKYCFFLNVSIRLYFLFSQKIKHASELPRNLYSLLPIKQRTNTVIFFVRRIHFNFQFFHLSLLLMLPCKQNIESVLLNHQPRITCNNRITFTRIS